MDSHLMGWDWFLLKPWKVQRIGDNIPCRQNAKKSKVQVDLWMKTANGSEKA